MLRFVKSMTLVMALVLILSIVGVQSTWKYAQSPVPFVSATLKFDVFPWTGSDILPEDSQVGENHRRLIDAIINGSGIGLNSSKSYLNDEIKDRKNKLLGGGARDTIGSVAITQREKLIDLFALESRNLNFLIRFVDDNTYEIFTTSIDLGEEGTIDWLGRNDEPGKPNIALGEYIYPIYRTTVTKVNGTWTAQETVLGAAKSDWYDESRINANATQIPSFDPDPLNSWVEGERGKTIDTAIWTFVGDSQTTIHNSKTEPLYYKIKDSNGGLRTVKSPDVGCIIKIYSSNQTLIATSTVKTDANQVQYVEVNWEATANTLYYITFEGFRNPSYSVS